VSVTAVAELAVVAVRLAVGDNDVSPGVLGFLVVALLGGATYLLIRSMNRQIKRIDLPDDAADRAPADGDLRDDPDDPDDAEDPGGVTPR
jgi:hypothetical protein